MSSREKRSVFLLSHRDPNIKSNRTLSPDEPRMHLSHQVNNMQVGTGHQRINALNDTPVSLPNSHQKHTTLEAVLVDKLEVLAVLIAGVSAYAVGRGVNNRRLAARLFWQVGLTAGVTFLVINLAMESLGWVVMGRRITPCPATS